MTTLSMPVSPKPRQAVPRSEWFGSDMPFARWGLIINLLIPLGLLIWDATQHKLGVNSVDFAIHTTGLIAILYLLLSLVVTPLRAITKLNWLIQFRRSLGVYAFFYGAAHLSIYFWWDRGGSFSSTVHEITHRYYLAIGFASLAIMSMLAVTSFNAAIRWMGAKSWKRLHRLTYLAATLGCIHYYLQSKADKRKPEIYLAILGGLLLWRVIAALVQRSRTPARVALAPIAGAKARFWKGDLRVVGMFRETPNVRTFRLAPPDGGKIPFAYSAGQFLRLTLQIDGKSVGRSYTIASPPTRDAYVELSIKREENGQVSRYLHDKLMTGGTVSVSGPSGRFTFDSKGETAVLLIAGGVGITPVMSILRDLTDRCWQGQIDLVFSVRSRDDVIFAAELDFLASRHPNLHVHKTITRDVPGDWTGPRGRVSMDLLRQLVPDFAARRSFVCGPDEMAAAVRKELIASGVAESRITLESFTPAGAVQGASQVNSATTSDRVASVTFATSDKTLEVAAGQTVLEAAEQVGVPIEFDCRSGICGTCRCKLLDGSVTMTVRDALSDADEADGYILACQAHALTDLVVDA